MSVVGYLSRSNAELWMPKSAARELGAQFKGAVLTGEKSVEERLTEDIVRPNDECYECVEEYDPVLKL